jgi:glyoxylase-like metal-dependent hydrolase (beta-lactamase superfamily II)
MHTGLVTGLMTTVLVSGLWAQRTANSEYPKVPNIAPGFALPQMKKLSDDVYVGQLSPKLWVHTTVGVLDDGSKYVANGILLLDGDGSILFDAGWNADEARTLLDWAAKELKHPVVKAYVTHFHSDRTGGMAALEQRGIPVYGSALTIELAAKAKNPVPDHAMPVPSEPVRVAGDAMILFPGAGHTRDNLVVYFPQEHTVYGGCFLKAADAENLGNIADADTKAWPASVKKMQAAFPEESWAIPGHGPMNGDAVGRTLELLKH